MICKKQRPDPEVTKIDHLNTMAVPRNSVPKSYEQNWSHKNALAES